MLPHGEWLPWLTEQVEFSERTARNFMRLAREWTNRQALADLGAAKALTLLALPPEEREQFMAENHIVNGEEKTVIDMTSRELEKAVKERDEALRAAEEAKAAAFRHAGVSASSVSGLEIQKDRDDGQELYEIEFRVGSTEYEYEIRTDGTILKAERDTDD